MIVNTGISITDYFNQKRKQKHEHVNGTKHSHHQELQKFTEEDLEPENNIQEVEELAEKPKKKKKKNKCNGNDQEMDEIEPITENHANKNSEESNTKKRKKNKADLIELVEEEQEVPAKKKKKSKNIEEQLSTEGIVDKKINKKKKKKNQAEDSVEPSKAVSNVIPESSQNNKKNSNDVDRPRGANALYTDVILIPSHIAQKMGNVLINKFNHSNIGDIVGYGMTDDIEIKVVETKMGSKDSINNDKYALYNMDRITRERVNPRKILTKIKKIKKSIQVI